MEKIYMQEEQSSKNSKSSSKVSVVLSFVIAAFAVVSLMAAGFSQISYAAPNDDTATLANFTMYQQASSGTNYIGILPLNSTGSPIAGYKVNMYRVNDASGNHAYCIQKNVATDGGTTYTRGETITDNGLLYLLNEAKTGNLSVSLDSVNESYREYVKTYIYQSAIWLYMADKYPNDDNHSFTADQKTAVTTSDNVRVSDTTSAFTKDFTVSGLSNQINTLVSTAKSETGTRYLSAKFNSSTLNLTSDEKYYQSDKINITTPNASDLQSLSFELSGITGAFLVDGNGNKVDTIQQGQTYYVRIPKESVTETAQTLTFKVNGTFTTLTGAEFIATDKQTVITVTPDSRTIISSDSIEVVGSPDTGMSVSQTIYFIGLIVLLCGVGIVYANAKPAEVK